MTLGPHAMGRIVVVGGGIAGLAAAHRLARDGARVTLFEASAEVGGLGAAFDYAGVPVERFYHCMLPSDRHLLGLLREIGLADEVYWKPTSFGYLQGTRIYPLNGAADLLRFDALPLVDRLRIGATGLWGRLRRAEGLDDVTCAQWLARLSGPRAFATFWRPMLQAKFGDRYDQVPALWFWTRFNREKGREPEHKGYLPGGYRRIASALARSIEGHGGALRLNTAVQSIELDDAGAPCVQTSKGTEHFDRLVFAGPWPALQRLRTGGALAAALARCETGIDAQGVINAVLVLRRSLSPHYWVASIDDDMPFQGIVETTRLIDRSALGGHHLVYLTRYTHRSEAAYAEDDASVLDRYTGALLRRFPDLRTSDIVDRFVFRNPCVEPIYRLGYAARKPPLSLVPGRVYLATTAQVYPDVTSWNGSVGLVERVLDQMEREWHPGPATGAAGSPRIPAMALGEPA